MEVKLVVAEGVAKGRVIPLPPTVFLIGRGPQCHLRPHCTLVSKLHCAIARWAGKVVVRDLKSANGTYINEKRIQAEVRIHDGDTLRVGALAFIFSVKAECDDLMPVQVVREGDVRWLLESPDESGTLKTADTKCYEIAELAKEEGGALPKVNGNVTLSAGQFLRDYVKKVKR
jgi:pSer/pThr/pTyr-binding forkhead associated (FHA) protein